MAGKLKALASLRNANLLVSLVLFVWLVWYFYTGFGGPRELVTHLLPIALVVHILIQCRQGGLYKELPRALGGALAILYILICAYAFYYFFINYEDIAIYRQGSYTTEDFIVGLLVFLLVMELSRLAHPVLFWVNVVLVAYTLWGYLSPIDFFWHPGTSFYRVITSSTVELATGVYGLYAQLALTMIAAFLLIAAVANGFDAQNALVQFMRRLAGGTRAMVPQTAVLASLSIGMVSGSGAANAAVVGSFTIPLMKRYGFPGAFAGAVETAASMGGLIMPPLMAAAGFLMAEFLGVPYWEVVIRAFALAAIYYGSLALAVYLLSVRLMPNERIEAVRVPGYAQVRTAIFFGAVVTLCILMGGFGLGALRAALYTAIALFCVLLCNFLLFKYALKNPEVAEDSLWERVRIFIETHAEMTSYLVLLMATLGIMIGLFTVTGFILRMGTILLQLGEFHVIATILAAWVFGWLVGAGLPPTATYIILAVIIVKPLQEIGVDPWVAHFFCFLIAVWGELSPPTSLAAAVAARIAEASFMRTMFEALKLCIPITFMSFAIFVREDVVVNPGWPQIADTLIILIGICGVTFAMFGRFFETASWNGASRVGLAALSCVVVLHPDDRLALGAAFVVLVLTAIGIWRHRIVGAPPSIAAVPLPAK
ncbi:MAG TPA: TRAP transporter fused permease subunit [Alphaproteobacteria bacterium]